MTLIHGGQLHQVAAQYKIPVNNWLDLSTGIAPLSYAIPDIPLALWQQLPQKNADLLAAAQGYYQCSQPLLVTNGSQSIIKALPLLWAQKNSQVIGKLASTVYLPERGYKEHGQAWQDAGHLLCFYQDELPEITELTPYCVLVVINPNNPTGKLFSRETLQAYQQAIRRLHGLLVIDEAFMDVIEKPYSMGGLVTHSHTLVLRSFGKFFGLAGIRLGFLIANDEWRKVFSNYLGPWQVNGPAQFIAQVALLDTDWQAEQKQTLSTLKATQVALLQRCWGDDLIATMHGCNLFITVTFHADLKQGKSHFIAQQLYHLLCLQGVYVRLADENDTLRFGIALTKDLPKLEQALLNAKNQLVALNNLSSA
ncbi:pyridoxal phosphate-dependent class II aminotransferase [Colwellia sp. D2M02]|uniref:threonine-phosphate decarboxylase n=1 Tax=Colwellia sp. D2M02 TaxID=2841562 RepID=UPI001C09B332|nr:threonine-phosphate decarboxylase [Colwellia sp. D2M02]MBU2891859.1 pyridoxal phosphate-dependent class II aminotransferase [Colwellia sp. D2M02]